MERRGINIVNILKYMKRNLKKGLLKEKI